MQQSAVIVAMDAQVRLRGDHRQVLHVISGSAGFECLWCGAQLDKHDDRFFWRGIIPVSFYETGPGARAFVLCRDLL